MTLAGSAVSKIKVNSPPASPRREQLSQSDGHLARDCVVVGEYDSTVLPVVVTPTSQPSAEPANDTQETNPPDGGRSEEEVALNDDDSEDEARALARCNRLSTTITYTLDRIMSFRYSTPDHPLGGPNKLFTFSCQAHSSNYNCRMEARTTHFGVWCISPLRVPEEQRVRVAEFIARVNYTLLLGLFDMDLSDGEVRFKIIHRNVEGVCNSPRLITTFFGIALQMMDKYFPGMMKVTYAGMSPEQAARDCERDGDDENEVGAASSRGGVVHDQ
jgi:hypothetical protein